MRVHIVIDSTADLPRGERERFDIVPLTIRFGEQEYIDGVTMTHQEFYEKLIESDGLPTTSQAGPDSFSRVFRSIADAGDSAVVLTVSSRLSGTYQSAMIAAEEYAGRVFVVDSSTVASRLTEERENVRLVALLDTLEYLKRGGRISRTAAMAGGLLNIKPVICIRDGAIEMLGKARGSRQGNNLLVKEIEQAGGVDFSKPVMLGYTGISDALLKKYVQDSAQLWEGSIGQLPQTMIGSVVGTHAGPGAIAVAFFAK